MRFAVHGPGCPVASPPVKGDGEVGGVPRRDVDGRVHVRVAGETAGSALEHGVAGPKIRVSGQAAAAGGAERRRFWAGGLGGWLAGSGGWQPFGSDDEQVHIPADRGHGTVANPAELSSCPLVGHGSHLLGHGVRDLLQPGALVGRDLDMVLQTAIPGSERDRDEEPRHGSIARMRYHHHGMPAGIR